MIDHKSSPLFVPEVEFSFKPLEYNVITEKTLGSPKKYFTLFLYFPGN